MAIFICDAIMGSGKSSAAIHYMNEHPERKFIYITPFLGEAARIRKACPALHFIEPNNKLPECGFSKYRHIKDLLRNGDNITSTHSLFNRFSVEVIDDIRRNEYTLIIDEDIECLEKCTTISVDDLNDQIRLGRAQRMDNGTVMFQNFEGYHGFLRDIMDLAEERELIDTCPDGDSKTSLLLWVYPRKILEAFSDVFVLTYMFNAQTIKWYFDLEGLPYRYIHTSYDGKSYSFTDGKQYIPPCVQDVKSKIHIVGSKRMNQIGDDKHALSVTWFQTQCKQDGDEIRQLSKNLSNYFKNVVGNIPISDRMWTTYEVGKSLVRDKGYMRSDTSFNIRATNELRNKRALAYCVNVFMYPFEKIYLSGRGVPVDEDAYALSSMVQWIWRSAIRDGGEIWLYIPSSRMRKLLIDWMDSLAKGGVTE